MNKLKSYSFLLRIFVGIIFIYSAYSKLFPAENFELYLYTQSKLNWTLVTFLSRFLVSIEFIIGLLLIINLNIKKTLQASFLLLIFFTIYLGYKYIAGHNDSNCYCFGEHFKMDIGESILKNIFLLIAIIIAYLNKKIILFKYKNHLSVLLVITGIILPIILSPPDILVYSSKSKEHPNEINDSIFNNFSGQKNENFNISDGKVVLCFFSMNCKFCKLTSKKITVFEEKYGSEFKTGFVFFGDSLQLDDFWMSNNDIRYPYKIMKAKELLKISGPSIPAIFFIDDGKILGKYGYRDLDENSLQLFLSH